MVLALALVACGIMVGLTYIAYYAIAASMVLGLAVGLPVGLGLLLVSTLLIPFAFGRSIEPYGWLVGPAAVLATVFLFGPLALSGFTANVYAWAWGGLPWGVWLIMLFIPLSVVGGWLGHTNAKKPKHLKLTIDNAYTSVVPVVAILVILAVAGMPITNFFSGNRTRTVNYARAGFRMTIPAGWQKENIPWGSAVPRDWVDGESWERRGAVAGRDTYVSWNVWSTLRFAKDERPVASFTSDAEAIKNLENDLRDETYGSTRVVRELTIGGRPALKAISTSGTFPYSVSEDYYVVCRPYFYTFGHVTGDKFNPPKIHSKEFQQEVLDFEKMVKSVRFSEPRPSPDG